MSRKDRTGDAKSKGCSVIHFSIYNQQWLWTSWWISCKFCVILSFPRFSVIILSLLPKTTILWHQPESLSSIVAHEVYPLETFWVANHWLIILLIHFVSTQLSFLWRYSTNNVDDLLNYNKSCKEYTICIKCYAYCILCFTPYVVPINRVGLRLSGLSFISTFFPIFVSLNINAPLRT